MTEEGLTNKEMSSGLKTSTFAIMSAFSQLDFPQNNPELVERFTYLLKELEDFQLLCKIQYLSEKIDRHHESINTLQSEKADVQADREMAFLKRTDG